MAGDHQDDHSFGRHSRTARLAKTVPKLHAAIADRLHRSLLAGTVLDFEQNRWIAAHMIFSRSSRYAQATAVLMKSGHWEATAPLIRTVFEDAAVLCYIGKQGEKADDYAELYRLSDALDRLKLAREIWPSEPERERHTAKVEAAFRRYLAKGAVLGLWAADESIENRLERPWNKRSITKTFNEAGLGPQHEKWYSEFSVFSHSSAFACSYGFAEQPLRSFTDRDEDLGRFRFALAIALGLQLTVVGGLTGVGHERELDQTGERFRELLLSSEPASAHPHPAPH